MIGPDEPARERDTPSRPRWIEQPWSLVCNLDGEVRPVETLTTIGDLL